MPFVGLVSVGAAGASANDRTSDHGPSPTVRVIAPHPPVVGGRGERSVWAHAVILVVVVVGEEKLASVSSWTSYEAA